jgi:hypothetical protein
MSVRPEEIRENIELGEDWRPKRGASLNIESEDPNTELGRRSRVWSRFSIVLTLGLPVHLVVAKVLYGLFRDLARNGLTFFEIGLMISTISIVGWIYAKAIR